ncbi:MAG: hypothetical protein KDD11_08830 [Acidobacteria bacterium]|nr:hypothetical protein [Acidobacteriota bacterium]
MLDETAQYSRLVVFDTNAIEGRYLEPLLRGETCRDLALVRACDPPYVPALYVKSFYEICQHAKDGRSFRWLSHDFGYPGGKERGRHILEQIPDVAEETLFWWFHLCEEWRGLDWHAEQSRIETHVVEGEQEAALRELQVRRDFSQWKFALTAFCERVWDVLEANFKMLTVHDTMRDADRLFQVERSLALNSLVPNEDFEFVMALQLLSPAAFVTMDAKLLTRTGLSLSLNVPTAFLHPDRLADSIAENFSTRWTREQSCARSKGGG